MAGERAPWDRANPSPRYQALLDLYRRLHAEGESRLGLPAAETFAGQSLAPHLPAIRELVRATGARTLLDYGSGKGLLHRARPLPLPGGGEAPSLTAWWGLERTVCYDPAYPPHAARPAETFDLVVCTDVLEHCPEEDLDWILGELFGFARHAVYLCIACYPAKKSLPNGENAHVTVRPPDWWRARLEAAAGRRPGVAWQAAFDRPREGRLERVVLQGEPRS